MCTVLLVDDNAFSRELVTDLLKPIGLTVIEADRAGRGTHLAAAYKPDLIIMDIAMPGVGGIKAMAMLKRNPATSNIPLIVLSAHAMPADKLAASEAGCAAYMTKPINVRTFASDVISVLSYVQPGSAAA